MTGDRSGLPELVDGVGERYELLGTGSKPCPSCGSTHTTVDALLALRAKHPEFTPQRVELITVYTATTTPRDYVGWP